MLSRVSCWRPCSIKNMYYTLFLISLCAALHVWMLDGIIDFTNKTLSLFSPRFTTFKFIPDPNTKYILSWDHKYLTSNVTDSFQKFNCPVKNCIFTTNKDLLNLSAFDAIVFGENILTSDNRPRERSPHQIFVYMSIESSYKFPACELYNDDYFNWTFTYRFDSDVLWRPFVVRNLTGVIVAPSTEVVWSMNSAPLRSDIKSTLQSKMRAVVWILDDYSCAGFDYLLRLEKHLYHFELKLYKHRHFKKNSLYDSDILPQNYQFVVGFENSIVKDYVTRKVMEGYRNYAVPIVYGGANYGRFLPPGSYINARVTHPYNLAQAIYKATKSQEAYERYFKWRNDYSIEEDHSSLCDLCAALNGDRAKYAPAKKKFRVWWNSPNRMHLCLPIDNSDIEKNANFTIPNLQQYLPLGISKLLE